MKKMVLIMAMAALVCWLPGQALADLTAVDSTGSPTLPAGDYGTVTVTLNAGNTVATVTITPTETPTDLDLAYGGTTRDAFLSVANPSSGSFTVAVNDSYTGSTVSEVAGTFGSFDVNAYHTGSAFGTLESIIFTLTASGTGTWANAAAVLDNNGSGYNAAADVYNPDDPGQTAYIAEPASTVPLPTTALLLGSGLLGLALLGLRRKGMAFQL